MPLRPRTDLDTHTVANQPAERGDVDLWQTDLPLREAVAREGGDAGPVALFGAVAGTAARRLEGRQANRCPPELRTFDRGGRRIDEVEFHPSYHALMTFGIAAGYPSVAWEGRPGGHVAHAAMVYLMTQVEPGVCCPMTMSYAAAPVVPADWRARLLTRAYDPASRPAPEKAGATIGMAMTEKQGGSDVRANTTRAEKSGDSWTLTGHKWFCSAPMSDAFLTLAQTRDGLACFLVPRWTPDGERNPVHLMRLKDKLGNRANASAEIEYHRAYAEPLGAPGDGVRTILAMVHHTRLDTAMAPAGLMRAALSEALWWTANRTAFQRRLIDQPLMESVLADLALETEAALALGLRVARAFDEDDRAFARIGVALAKFLNNRRCPAVVVEAMECLGGIGYVEEGLMPLLYREAPLNSIWEGSGNVICLDVLRTLTRDAPARDALRDELATARGLDPLYDHGLDAFVDHWPGDVREAEARWLVERLATLLAAATLLRAGVDAVAGPYVATRIGGLGGRLTGSLPAGIDRRALIERSLPC